MPGSVERSLLQFETCVHISRGDVWEVHPGTWPEYRTIKGLFRECLGGADRR